MDRRVVFFLVFVVTFVSTALVAGVCLITRQPALDTVLYSMITMWIMGVVSQLLLQNLYQAIVKPMEQDRQQARMQQNSVSIDLDDVEEIEQANQMIKNAQADNDNSETAPQELSPPTVGVHVEQKG